MRFMHGLMAHGMPLGSLLVCVRSWVVAGLLPDLGVNRIFGTQGFFSMGGVGRRGFFMASDSSCYCRHFVIGNSDGATVNLVKVDGPH
jgi:hypothetical protein